jgi:hypothetical protein
MDAKVAQYYRMVMGSQLKVGIGLDKTLISTLGYFEFAKVFANSSLILSGMPLKAFSAFGENLSSYFDFFRQYDLTSTTFLRFMGFGSLASGNMVKESS